MSLTPEPDRQIVGVFLGVSARDVDRHDANGFVGRIFFAGILDEGRLHDADQRLAVRRQREPLHALVVGAPARVGACFNRALRGLNCDGEIAGQSEGLDHLPGGAIELPDIRPIFVRDEDGLAIIGHANRLRVEARVRGHRGTAGSEIVGPAGEIKLARRVLSRRAWTDAEAGPASIGERRRTGEQGRLGQRGGQGEGQGPARVRGQIEVQRLKPADVGGRIVDRIIVLDGVRTAVGNRQECVAPGEGEARAQAAQDIRGHAIFQSSGQARQIAGPVQGSDRQQAHVGARRSDCDHRQQQSGLECLRSAWWDPLLARNRARGASAPAS